MRYPVAIILLLTFLGGCAGGLGKSFTIRFQPFSAQLDTQAQATVQAAVTYAKANPLMPLTVDGYLLRPDPTEFGTMRQLRVGIVTSALIKGGVSRARIQVLGDGLLYAQGVPIPGPPGNEVEIRIGL